MDPFSPTLTYALGALILLIATSCFARPSSEYTRFGLALEHPPPPSRKKRAAPPSSEGSVSPLIYVKGIRELTLGLALLALQAQGGQGAAVTTVAGVVSLAGLGDAFIIWFHGGDGLRYKAGGHFATFLLFAGWAAWRAASA